MSTEFRPPFPPGWSAPRVQTNKFSKSPPVTFSTQSNGRGHFRSSSLGSFVSRLLPSRRQERGHTLRSGFNEDGMQDVAELVFNVPSTKPRKRSEAYHGISSMLKKSWPRRNSVDASIAFQTPVALDDQTRHFHGQSEQARRFSLGDMVGFARQARQSSNDETRETLSTGEKKKGNALSRMIGSIKRAKGEQKRDRRDSNPSQSHIRQLVESIKSCPETAKFSTEKEITKSQQIFVEDKKLRREQRRSLQESGDFLGVQGANPRTGFWDISDVTSSSEPSQMSENTKLKLGQQATKLAEQKKKYDEAQKSYREELMRLEALNELKKRERAEQKKIESKMRQRRQGKWRASETGWSSVFEPELSPIQQSEAGTPVAELAPGDRLFPMPCASDLTPYINDTPIKQRDYVSHRAVSSPLAHKRPGHSTDGLPISPRGIPRKPVRLLRCQRTEESSETIVHTHDHSLPSIPARKSVSSKGQQNPFFHTHGRQAPSIRVQKSLPIQSEQQTSVCNDHGLQTSDTVQKLFLDTAQQQQSTVAANPVLAASGSAKSAPQSFLEKRIFPSKPVGLLEKRATAISSRSESTKQVTIRPPLVQSLDTRRIVSLNELPPVTLKDPIAARIPLSYQTPKLLLTTLVPSTNLRTVPARLPSFINTSIITTTGCAPRLLLPGQVDGAGDIRTNTLSRQKYPQHLITHVPLRASSQRRIRLRETHRAASTTHPADITILSALQLDLTKERSIKLCHITSPEADKGELKSTLISISTYPQNQKKREKTAKSAALLAFQQVRHPSAIKKTEGQNGGQLPPKMRKHKKEHRKDIHTKGIHKLAQGENVGTGDPSKTKKQQVSGSSKALRVTPMVAARAATLKFAASDRLAAWHPEPSTEKEVGEAAGTSETGAHMKALVLYKRRGVSSRKCLPRPGRRPQSGFWQVLTGLAQVTWLVVEALFERHSGMRKRFEPQHLTWQDAGLFVAAAMFMYVVATVLVRVLGLGLLMGKILAIVFLLLFVL